MENREFLDQTLITRIFSNELIQSVLDMRVKQNEYFQLKSRKHLKFNDPIIKKALQDSIIAEKKVDTLLDTIIIKPKTEKIEQGRLF